MATREKNGLDQPIRSSSHAPSLYKLSLPRGPLPSSALVRRLGRRREREKQVEGLLLKKEEDE